MAHNERLNRFNNIINAWNNHLAIPDIYHLILYWLEDYEPTFVAVNDVNDIFKRMNNNESMNLIVTDFVAGNCYQVLRNEVINN